VLLMIILLIMVMKNKEPIYLKPKTNNDVSPSDNNTPSYETTPPPYVPTQANENDEVLRSELQSLRQSAVSMSVSEKAGANQIVQDWIDDAGTDGEVGSADNLSDEENTKEDKK